MYYTQLLLINYIEYQPSYFSFHLVKSNKNPSCYVVMLCYVCYVFYESAPMP